MTGWRRTREWANGRALVPALLLVCAAMTMPACTRAQAKVTPDQPLDVPAPPPREVDVNDAEPPAPVPLVAEPARNAPARTRPAPANTPRPEAPHPDASKPEPSAAEPPKPAEEPKPAAAPTPPPPTTLQTTPTENEGEVERAIRASLARANADLNRIDYRLLNRDARTQYDTAKRFVQQADSALREKNLIFAKTVADKAVVLAAQLSSR
jgi:outer membrane biosynthesis protein TonB